MKQVYNSSPKEQFCLLYCHFCITVLTVLPSLHCGHDRLCSVDQTTSGLCGNIVPPFLQYYVTELCIGFRVTHLTTVMQNGFVRQRYFITLDLERHENL